MQDYAWLFSGYLPFKHVQTNHFSACYCRLFFSEGQFYRIFIPYYSKVTVVIGHFSEIETTTLSIFCIVLDLFKFFTKRLILCVLSIYFSVALKAAKLLAALPESVK